MPMMHSRAIVTTLALTILLANPITAQEIRFNVVPYKLDNGLRVLALEDHSIPTVTYYTFFRVGSRDERPGRTGISHLFEHMMFKGSKNYGPGVFDRAIESSGGFSNAFTAEDMTAYYETVPADALDQVIPMEADRMASMQIDDETLKSEREVVKEERRLRIDNDVSGSVFELLRAQAYVAHPYGWPVAGWMPDLDAIGVGDCQDYFRTHYAPNNATVILVGDFKADHVIEVIGKAYGPIPSQTPAPPVVRDEPEQKGERRAVLRKAAQLPAVAIAWHVPPTSAPEVFPLDLLQIVLGDGDSSRLVRRLVYEKELATSVGVRNDWRVDPSTFEIFAEAKPGVAAGALEAAIEEEIDRVAKEGVSDSELKKAKNIRTTTQVKALKTSSGKAEQLGLFEIDFGSYQRLFTILRAYEAVTAADLRSVAARYLGPDNRTVVTLQPTSEEPAK
jgi:zinc protease